MPDYLKPDGAFDHKAYAADQDRQRAKLTEIFLEGFTAETPQLLIDWRNSFSDTNGTREQCPTDGRREFGMGPLLGGKAMADTASTRLQRELGEKPQGYGDRFTNGSEKNGGVSLLPDTAGQRQQRQGEPTVSIDKTTDRQRETSKFIYDCERCIWLPEPRVGRVVNGLSGRVDRIIGLGNAIVPQVAAEIIRTLLVAYGIPIVEHFRKAA